MSKEQKQDFRTAVAKGLESNQARRAQGHGFEGPVRSKVKGGAHTKAELKRSGTPQGDRIGERTRGLS
ncbi:hypothetical protein OHU17_20675 [Streptomyces goshikiensis]|uniref:Uncharacterized protein n=1 Tax=Streptomyces goshikiensis TaxID=1942 RepID=A0ABZ1RQ33_9ACTN|nr:MULTISPECIES: hypothetical protein [Streptomyces]RPK50496.1 hypothetical protein EES37_05935 [Streptomyces sp. ADI91-18]WBY20655.1 hypothetical protein PET44_14085 [Streptomyces goshikiensis]WSR99430.1 hypothetical protein OG224_15945 [Streptomyces goshikiensis]WSX99546.1 hypothetical protein OG590_21230 [Streptomyces goshikiensis]GHD78450.1 hypothetical protein GCM10010336_58980 [Streptomyces goshikiensis]